jgi:hypothetical protein
MSLEEHSIFSRPEHSKALFPMELMFEKSNSLRLRHLANARQFMALTFSMPVISQSSLHSVKQLVWIVVRRFDRCAFLSFTQPLKTPWSRNSTESGILISSKSVYEKAPSLILLRLSGNVMLLSPVYWNANEAMKK